MSESLVLTLARYCYGPEETRGRLYAPSAVFDTVERPWLQNQAYLSCIPEGRYPVAWRYFHRGGYWTLEIREVPMRAHILIHSGTIPEHVQGCVGLPGRSAVDEFLEAVRSWSKVPVEHALGDPIHPPDPIGEIVVGQIPGARWPLTPGSAAPQEAGSPAFPHG